MKQKSKAIHAELRKESKKFGGWLKYEITIKHPNGGTEQVPAYGKDLQDALSRVAHDQKVVNIENKILKKIPDSGWAIAWVLGMVLITSSIYYNINSRYVGYYLIGGMASYVISTLSISNWFKLKNKYK